MQTFRVGDIVRILKRGTAYPSSICWSPIMDDYIGRTGIVSKISSGCYRVKIWNSGRDPYLYPWDSLELEVDQERLNIAWRHWSNLQLE